jgi:hypothetical protein
MVMFTGDPLVVALLLIVNVPAPIEVTVEPPGMPAPVTDAPTASPAVEETAVMVLLPAVTVPVMMTVPVPVHCPNKATGSRQVNTSTKAKNLFIAGRARSGFGTCSGMDRSPHVNGPVSFRKMELQDT